MTKKVIAVDLDGTLLDSNSNLSDFTKGPQGHYHNRPALPHGFEIL